MLELDIHTAGNNSIIVNDLELIRALEELGIHTKKSGNPFWFILNFKGINYTYYSKDGINYIPPVFKLVEDNYIACRPENSTIDSFFGIKFSKIDYIHNTIYKIIGYWTDDDNF